MIDLKGTHNNKIHVYFTPRNSGMRKASWKDWTSSFCAYAMLWEEKEKSEHERLWRETLSLRFCFKKQE